MKLATNCLYILLVIYLNLAQTLQESFDPYLHNATRRPSGAASGLNRLEPSSWWYHIIYDDGYIRRMLDERYPYLKRPNGSYAGLRDHFNFEQVFWPSESHLAKINVEQHMYDEQRAMDLMTVQTSLDIWSYSRRDELALSGGAKKDDGQCMRHMRRLYREIERAEAEPDRLFGKGATNIELLRWIDSWGRPVSETYFGNSFWTGSYRGCKYAQVDLERANGSRRGAAPPIKFNYCWAKLAARDFPQRDEMRPRMSMRAGICIPESCDTIQANRMKEKILRMLQFNFSPMHKRRFNRLLDIYCLPQRGPILSSRLGDLPAEPRWFLLVTGAWLALILAVSCYYQVLGRARGRRAGAESWLKALTVQESLRVFMRHDQPTEGSRVDLRALGLIKMLSCLMVLFAHCFLQSYWNFHSTTIMVYECRRLHYYGMQFTWKTLEIFLVVTGVITSYFIISKFPGDRIGQLLKPRNFLLLQLVRYVRLAPVMAFTCAFMKAIFVHLSEGPFWDYGTWRVSPQGACQAVSWWRILIWPIILDPQARGGSPYQHECLPSSWYVVTELKMYLIIPFFIYMLVAWRRARIPLMALTIGASTFFKYLQLEAQQIAYFDQFFKYGEMHIHNLFIVSLESAYFTVADRFHAMAIGLFAGTYLYRYKVGKIKQWPFWMRHIFPVVFVGWQVYDLFLRTRLNEVRYRQTGETPSDASIMAWLTLKPRLDAILIALLSLRLATDWSHKMMQHSLTIYKLSKLTYCVYMIHTPVIMFVTTAHEKTRPDTVPLQLAMMAAFVVVISFVIALPAYLLVESPFTLLVDHFLSKYKPSTILDRSSSSVSINRMIISDKTNNGAGELGGQRRATAKLKAT